MEDIRKTTKLQKEINGKTYDVEVEVIRRKHLTGGIEFKINVTIKLDGHEVHDTAVELAVFKALPRCSARTSSPKRRMPATPKVRTS